MRVVFVDNFYTTRIGGRLATAPSPHLGLMSLSAVLEEAGREARIVDPKLIFNDGGFDAPTPDFYARWADEIAAAAPDAVGFTAYGRTLPAALTAARLFKARAPETPVMLGGPHATIVGRAILEAFEAFSIVARHEAETIIAPLVDALERGRGLEDVPNLIFRAPDGSLVETPAEAGLIDIDRTPYPALHLYDRRAVSAAEMSVEAGRGCPFACTFCSTANFFKRRYRLKSNERLVDEMERMRREYGVNVFNLNHDLFGLNKKSLREFCRLVDGRGFEWKCSMRSDTLDVDLLDTLRAAGCRDIYFGVETGSARLQRAVKKGLDLEATKAAVARVINAGLSCTVSFITGFREETEEDQDATLDMIGWFWGLDARRLRTQLHMLSPEPGSELSAGGHEIFFDGVGPEADDIGDADLILQHPAIFSVFYHYRSAVPRWRVITASAFVTFVAPLIGAPFLNHLLKEHFDGRLSRLFRRLAPREPDVPLNSHAAIVAFLHARFAALIDALCATAPYLDDLHRLSGVMSRLIAGVSPDNAGGAAAVLLPLGHDIAALSRVLDAPDAPPPPSSMTTTTAPTQGARATRWYVIDGAAAVDPVAYPIAETEAEKLVETICAESAAMREDFENKGFLYLI